VNETSYRQEKAGMIWRS